MSSELECARAMVNLEFKLLEPMLLVTGHETAETESRAKFDEPAVKIMFQVTQIVRFLLERHLRFRHLGFCGHDLIYIDTERPLLNTPAGARTDLPGPGRTSGGLSSCPAISSRSWCICLGSGSCAYGPQ